MKTVCIESPLAGDFEKNIRYARACLRYCLEKGASPYASHLLLPQVFDDLDASQREAGINAGLAMGDQCDERWVFIDLGVSSGMMRAVQRADENKQPLRRIELPPNWADAYKATPTPGFASDQRVSEPRPMNKAPRDGTKIYALVEVVWADGEWASVYADGIDDCRGWIPSPPATDTAKREKS